MHVFNFIFLKKKKKKKISQLNEAKMTVNDIMQKSPYLVS
jgi:hypothetical protein